MVYSVASHPIPRRPLRCPRVVDVIGDTGERVPELRDLAEIEIERGPPIIRSNPSLWPHTPTSRKCSPRSAQSAARATERR
jgi:hypothetical protein